MNQEQNTYVNIVNGEEIEMSVEDFEKSFTSFEDFARDFFKDRNFRYKIQKEDNRSGITEFDFSYEDVPFHAVFMRLKNSGLKNSERDKYNKRMQIGNNLITYDDDIPHFVIASYNTYDKIMYFVVELKEYIKNKSNDRSYSSFWVDYSFIDYTYKKGYSINRDSKGRIIIGIDNNRIKEFEDEDLIKRIFITENDYYDNAKKRIDKIKEKKVFIENEETTYNPGIKLKRNQLLKKEAFERENYTCELCGTNSTFKNKSGEEYFEGHHLIMYNISSQRKYKYSLDTSDNIICLCPTCHRKIHYGTPEEIECSINKLVNKHKNLFEIYEFDDIKRILENYLDYERDDDDE